jgi:hypothetical protein
MPWCGQPGIAAGEAGPALEAAAEPAGRLARGEVTGERAGRGLVGLEHAEGGPGGRLPGELGRVRGCPQRGQRVGHRAQ